MSDVEDRRDLALNGSVARVDALREAIRVKRGREYAIRFGLPVHDSGVLLEIAERTEVLSDGSLRLEVEGEELTAPPPAVVSVDRQAQARELLDQGWGVPAVSSRTGIPVEMVRMYKGHPPESPVPPSADDGEQGPIKKPTLREVANRYREQADRGEDEPRKITTNDILRELNLVPQDERRASAYGTVSDRGWVTSVDGWVTAVDGWTPIPLITGMWAVWSEDRSQWVAEPDRCAMSGCTAHTSLWSSQDMMGRPILFCEEHLHGWTDPELTPPLKPYRPPLRRTSFRLRTVAKSPIDVMGVSRLRDVFFDETPGKTLDERTSEGRRNLREALEDLTAAMRGDVDVEAAEDEANRLLAADVPDDAQRAHLVHVLIDRYIVPAKDGDGDEFTPEPLLAKLLWRIESSQTATEEHASALTQAQAQAQRWQELWEMAQHGRREDALVIGTLQQQLREATEQHALQEAQWRQTWALAQCDRQRDALMIDALRRQLMVAQRTVDALSVPSGQVSEPVLDEDGQQLPDLCSACPLRDPQTHRLPVSGCSRSNLCAEQARTCSEAE